MTDHKNGSIEIWAGLQHHIDSLDTIICDLWGVMHDGLRLNVAAVEALQKARLEGIKTVFLSNAPRPRTYVRAHLLDMGMPTDLAADVVTSGGLARDTVRAEFERARLYHMGPESDRNTVEGLPVTEVSNLDDADVILITDLDFRDRPIEAHREILSGCAARGVPMLCANPDRIVHVGDTLYACAGAVADIYDAMGGPVRWFGKPTAQALYAAMAEVGVSHETCDRNRVIMIGDSLKTDIAGAKAASVQSLLIAGGIHREDIGSIKAFDEVVDSGKSFRVGADRMFDALPANREDETPIPDAMMRQFIW